MIEVILKRFEAPDETRLLTKGKFEIVGLGGIGGRRTSRAGSGPSTSGRVWGRPAAPWSISAWCFPGRQQQHLMMGGCLSFGLANYSTFPQFRTTVGS